METEAEPLRPFSVLAGLAVGASGQCSEMAFGIIMKLCLHAEAMPAFGPRFRPFMEPDHPDVESGSPHPHACHLSVGMSLSMMLQLSSPSGIRRAR